MILPVMIGVIIIHYVILLKLQCLRQITEKKLVSWRRNQNDRPISRRLHLNILQKYVVSKQSIQ